METHKEQWIDWVFICTLFYFYLNIKGGGQKVLGIFYFAIVCKMADICFIDRHDYTHSNNKYTLSTGSVIK